MGVLTRLSLFAYGFRPFFLGAACSGLVLVPWWAANFSFGVSLATDWPPTLWHAHEMLFGFTCAAIAGFLLTAVPSWTGRQGFAGGPLVLLSSLWLLGRVMIGSSASWPFAAVVAADLAFLPVLAAAIAQGARLAQWQGWRTLDEPIVWILHLAYAWLPFGLALKALAILTGMTAAAFWLHALTIGALATMILGVMTRVSLGHTGRPLRIRPLVTLAYLLVSGAALVRVLGAWLPGLDYPAVIVLSAALWTAAFAFFLWVYGPILLTPRVDPRSTART